MRRVPLREAVAMAMDGRITDALSSPRPHDLRTRGLRCRGRLG